MNDSLEVPVLPRSFLYVPASKPDLFAKATAGPADAVVLDLEDSVPLDGKREARSAVRRWLEEGDTSGAEQWVRVDAASVRKDLGQVLRPGLAGVFLAKTSLASVAALGEALDELEDSRGLERGAMRVVGLLEDARAFTDLPALAAASRLTTFGIGEVDLLADLRMSRTDRSAAAVAALRTQVVLHAAAAGLAAPVAPTSTDFRDLEAFAESTRMMQDLGFRSRTAIHPSQVPVLNEVLTPSPDEVRAAEDVVERFDAAGAGVTTDERGRLIDAAVVRQSQETLARAAAVRRR